MIRGRLSMAGMYLSSIATSLGDLPALVNRPSNTGAKRRPRDGFWKKLGVI